MTNYKIYVLTQSEKRKYYILSGLLLAFLGYLFYRNLWLSLLCAAVAKPLEKEFSLGKISITPYKGNHALGKLRGPVGSSASYSIRAGGRSLFITGDSLLDDLLRTSLNNARPDFLAAFAGSASFIFGSPITLGADELKQIARILPETKIIAVHMNAINHCSLTKNHLSEFAVSNGLSQRLSIPGEGAILPLGM